MRQHKTVVQIFVIFSISNLVLAVPLVRYIYDARGNVAVPTAVRELAVTSKEQHQSRSEWATASSSSLPPDGSTTSPSSSPPPDQSTTSHSSPLLPALYDYSSSEGEASFHDLPIHLDEQTAVSSPPGEIVPAAGQPVPVPWLPTSEGASASTTEQLRGMWEAQAQAQQSIRQTVRTVVEKVTVGLVTLGITGAVVMYYRHRNHHHRAIDPD